MESEPWNAENPHHYEMLSTADLISIAEARLQDAEALCKAARFDGAVYLVGYAVEIALKARICRTLAWTHYPATRGEFDGLLSFKTHDLDILLRLSGIELDMKSKYMTEWSSIIGWDPEARYKPVGSATDQSAVEMIESAKALVKFLC